MGVFDRHKGGRKKVRKKRTSWSLVGFLLRLLLSLSVSEMKRNEKKKKKQEEESTCTVAIADLFLSD